MKIISIQKPTLSDEIELRKFKEKSKNQSLTNEEKDRVLFLEMKQFWNCEC